MAIVAWVVPSSDVLNNMKNQMVLDNPLSMIELDNLPNNFSFNVAFSIIDIIDNENINLLFEVGEKENNEILAKMEFEINPLDNIPPELEGKKLHTFESNANLKNFKFKNAGIHYIKVATSQSESICYFKVINNGENDE